MLTRGKNLAPDSVPGTPLLRSNYNTIPIMKKTCFLTFAAVSVLLAGCVKNQQQVVEEPAAEELRGKVVTLSASIDVDDETKASVADDGSFTWATGDQIGVWISDNGGTTGEFLRFDLGDGEAGKSTADFTATLPDGYEVVEGPVVFPYRDDHAYNPGTQQLTFNQPDFMTMESAVTKSHMAAMYSGTGTVSLKHLSGLIRFTVFNVPATTGAKGYIRLRTNDKKTFGSFTVDMSADTPQIIAPGAASDQDFNLTFSSAPQDVPGKIYVANFPVPVGTYNYLRLSVQKSGGDMIGYKEKSSATTVTRAKMINMPEITLNTVELADNESGLRDNFNKVDYVGGYTGGIVTDATIEVVSNPKKTVMNASNNVLKVTSTADGAYGGLIDILTKGAFDADPVAYYPSGYRSGTKAFTVKVLYANASDATKYYPMGQCKSTQSEMLHPDRVNGQPFDGTQEQWAELIKPEEWNVLQWTCNNSGTYRIDIKPFLTFDGDSQTSNDARVIYFDDFRFLK